MDTIIPAQFYPLSLRGDFLLKKKLKAVVGYATMCNHSYDHEGYTVGTP